MKLNCKPCLDGNCKECIDEDCLCRMDHGLRELTNAFTEKMRELLPKSVEDLKELMRNCNASRQQQLTLYDTPIEDLKPNRWITLDEQTRFCEFLSSLGVSIDKLEWCASDWQKFRCSVTHSHTRKVTYVACGKRGICPRCSMSYASKRAGIMYQWVKQNLADRLDFDLKLNQIVLTLPEHLHDIERKSFAKMIKSFMSRFEIESYGYSIQTRHSADPLAGRYNHCHILSLNMKQYNNGIVESDYYFDVDKMREVWKEVIEKHTSSVIEGDVNLHTEYASVLYNRNKVLHMFAYLYRYPIQDLFNVQIRKQSIDYLERLQFEKINETLDSTDATKLQLSKVRSDVSKLMDEKKPRIVWCGLLTSVKRKELIDMIVHVTQNETIDNTPNTTLQLEDGNQPSFRWKSMAEIEKEMEKRAKECRDCGSPYEEEPFESGAYNGDNEPDTGVRR